MTANLGWLRQTPTHAGLVPSRGNASPPVLHAPNNFFWGLSRSPTQQQCDSRISSGIQTRATRGEIPGSHDKPILGPPAASYPVGLKTPSVRPWGTAQSSASQPRQPRRDSTPTLAVSTKSHEIANPVEETTTRQASPNAAEESTSTRVGKDLGWRTDFHEHYSQTDLKLVGQGGFGLVYEGADAVSGEPVAVKVLSKIRPSILKDGNLSRLQREVDVLKALQGSGRVVGFRGNFEDDKEVRIVMDLCAGTDLQKLVEIQGPLDEQRMVLVAFEMLHTIGTCHELGVLYGDVKPANFCLVRPEKNPLASASSEYVGTTWLKAVDFGASQSLTGTDCRFRKRAGTPVFIAPEVYARNYGLAADMWSLGVSLYWLYMQQYPFFKNKDIRTARLDEVVQAVTSCPILYDMERWSEISANGLDFIQSCLQRDEKSRMTVAEALTHPWFRDMMLASTPCN